MKTSFLFVCFSLIVISLHSQSISSLTVNLFPDTNSEKLTLKITSASVTLSNLQLQIFDANKKMMQSISLPNAIYNLDTTISLKKFTIGKYYYSITKGKKQMFEGEFVKDAYDEL